MPAVAQAQTRPDTGKPVDPIQQKLADSITTELNLNSDGEHGTAKPALHLTKVRPLQSVLARESLKLEAEELDRS